MTNSEMLKSIIFYAKRIKNGKIATHSVAEMVKSFNTDAEGNVSFCVEGMTVLSENLLETIKTVLKDTIKKDDDELYQLSQLNYNCAYVMNDVLGAVSRMYRKIETSLADLLLDINNETFDISDVKWVETRIKGLFDDADADTIDYVFNKYIDFQKNGRNAIDVGSLLIFELSKNKNMSAETALKIIPYERCNVTECSGQWIYLINHPNPAVRAVSPAHKAWMVEMERRDILRKEIPSKLGVSKEFLKQFFKEEAHNEKSSSYYYQNIIEIMFKHPQWVVIDSDELSLSITAYNSRVYISIPRDYKNITECVGAAYGPTYGTGKCHHDEDDKYQLSEYRKSLSVNELLLSLAVEFADVPKFGTNTPGRNRYAYYFS